MLTLSVAMHMFGAFWFLFAAIFWSAAMARERRNMIAVTGQMYRKLVAEYMSLGGDPDDLEEEEEETCVD